MSARGFHGQFDVALGCLFGVIFSSAVWFVLVFFVLTCSAKPLHAQASTAKSAPWTPFNYGYVDDSARVFLEQGWDNRNAFQVERAYCIEPADVSTDTTSDRANVEWHIHHVTLPSAVDIATPYAISFSCSLTAIASIHIHTPTTCVRTANDAVGQHPKACRLGGPDAFVCSVDEVDRHAAEHDAFTAIQCGKGQFVFYWPGKRG